MRWWVFQEYLRKHKRSFQVCEQGLPHECFFMSTGKIRSLNLSKWHSASLPTLAGPLGTGEDIAEAPQGGGPAQGIGNGLLELLHTPVSWAVTAVSGHVLAVGLCSLNIFITTPERQEQRWDLCAVGGQSTSRWTTGMRQEAWVRTKS